MRLTDLPAELLELIAWRCLDHGPDGSFESLVLACKKIFQSTPDSISTYNELIRWRKVIASADHPRARSSLDILMTISSQPLVSLYIESLNLRDVAEEWTTPEDQTSAARQFFAQGASHDFDNLVRQSRCLRLAHQDAEHWLSRMRRCDIPKNPHHDEGYPFRFLYRSVFLLTLLPNVRELALPRYWHLLGHRDSPADFNPVLQAIGEEAGSSQRLASLSRLNKMLPFHAQVEYEHRPQPGIDLLVPFLALPSLMEMHAVNIVGLEDIHCVTSLEWPFSSQVSSVRRLRLEGCCFDERDVRELLTRMPNLSSFAYSHDVKWDAVGDLWDARAFLWALASRSATLTDISITSVMPPMELEAGIDSLKKFKVLEKLRLDLSPIDNVDTPRLAEILPASIQVVEIWTGHDIDAEIRKLSSLFRDPEALTGREDFPHLEELVVYYGASIQYREGEIGSDTRAYSNKNHVRDVNELRRKVEAAGGRVLPDPTLDDSAVTQPVQHCIPHLTDPNYQRS